MVKGVEMKVTEATSEMSIQLDPENLGKINLKIVTENKYYAVPAIFIGNTEYSLKSKSRCTFSGQDAWRIRRHDGNLIISGTAPAGVLYGVYEFLEKYCGVFWLDLYYTSFPENKTISLSEKLDDSGKPAFAWRGIYTTFNDAPERVKFLLRNRENIFFEDTVALSMKDLHLIHSNHQGIINESAYNIKGIHKPFSPYINARLEIQFPLAQTGTVAAHLFGLCCHCLAEFPV